MMAYDSFDRMDEIDDMYRAAMDNDRRADFEVSRGDGPPKAKSQPSFKFVAVGDLQCREPEYLVADLIEAETLSLIFGDPGCGKSFLAVDLGLSIATGTAFHGRDTRQGSVSLSQARGTTGLHGTFMPGARRVVSRCLASRCSSRKGRRSFWTLQAQRL